MNEKTHMDEKTHTNKKQIHEFYSDVQCNVCQKPVNEKGWVIMKYKTEKGYSQTNLCTSCKTRGCFVPKNCKCVICGKEQDTKRTICAWDKLDIAKHYLSTCGSQTCFNQAKILFDNEMSAKNPNLKSSFVCANCGQEKEEMPKCARCKIVNYCDVICQKMHYADHKKTCKAPKT